MSIPRKHDVLARGVHAEVGSADAVVILSTRGDDLATGLSSSSSANLEELTAFVKTIAGSALPRRHDGVAERVRTFIDGADAVVVFVVIGREMSVGLSVSPVADMAKLFKLYAKLAAAGEGN